jgi:hypothetical protein
MYLNVMIIHQNNEVHIARNYFLQQICWYVCWFISLLKHEVSNMKDDNFLIIFYKMVNITETVWWPQRKHGATQTENPSTILVAFLCLGLAVTISGITFTSHNTNILWQSLATCHSSRRYNIFILSETSYLRLKALTAVTKSMWSSGLQHL